MGNSIAGRSSWTAVFVFSALVCGCGEESAESSGEATHAAESAAPSTSQGDGGNKLALLVGINKYQYVPDLKGTVNDVKAMRDLLVRSFQFPKEHIRVLTDASATRNGILSAIREHLIAKARPDSVVIFHYSGHGSRVKDRSGDESDGYDETLVPHDSGRRDHENRDITDDELNGLLRQLVEKTPNVTFILDSCFSGSALRGSGLARTVEPDDRDPPDRPESQPSRSRGISDGASGFRPANAQYALISGAADQEQAYEVHQEAKTYGALTWHLTQQIRQVGAEATYRDVMDLVRAKVTALFPAQHPQLEGARSDNLVFSDRSLVPEPYVLISPLSGRTVKLQAGQVHGVTAGSIFEVYPPGTKVFASAQPTGKIKVKTVEVISSEAEIIKGEVSGAASRAVEREHFFEDMTLGIHFGNPEGSPELQNIMKRLLSLDHIRKVDRPQGYDLLIRQEKGFFVTEAGEPTEISPRVRVSDEDAIKQVVAQVEKWAHWFGVLSIANPRTELAIEFLIEEPTGEGREVPKTHRDLDLTLYEGEKFEAKIANNSKHDIYFALLDVSSDGSIEVIYPRNQAKERLAVGQSWTRRLETFLPEGRDSIRDVLKVIATTEETDFSFLRQEAVRSPGFLNPLQQLLANAVYGEKRGTRLVEAGDWTTATRVLEVRKQ